MPPGWLGANTPRAPRSVIQITLPAGASLHSASRHFSTFRYFVGKSEHFPEMWPPIFRRKPAQFTKTSKLRLRRLLVGLLDGVERFGLQDDSPPIFEFQNAAPLPIAQTTIDVLPGGSGHLR